MDAEREAVKQQLLEIETGTGKITLSGIGREARSKAHIEGVSNDGRTQREEGSIGRLCGQQPWALQHRRSRACDVERHAVISDECRRLL